MSRSSVVHDTFTLERTYPASPARVFAAWADPKLKASWFNQGGEWRDESHQLDFREGGLELRAGRTPDGHSYKYAARFHDIVPAERIVFSYDMHVDERRISVSVLTVVLQPDGDGTRLTLTEQGAFLDTLDDARARATGFGTLLDALGEVLHPPPPHST